MANAEREKIVRPDLVQIPALRELGVRGSDEIFTLKRAKEEYLRNPTPESVTQFNQAFWTEKGKLIGKEFKITDFPGTIEGLKKLREEKKTPIFVPSGVTYTDLMKMFPEMDDSSFVEKGDYIVDINNDSGWLSIDDSIDFPDKIDASSGPVWIYKQQELGDPVSLKQYIIASQISKLSTGRYFDEGSGQCRLGSKYEHNTLYACFLSSGSLHVHSHFEVNNHYKSLGSRGVDVIKAA